MSLPTSTAVGSRAGRHPRRSAQPFASSWEQQSKDSAPAALLASMCQPQSDRAYSSSARGQRRASFQAGDGALCNCCGGTNCRCTRGREHCLCRTVVARGKPMGKQQHVRGATQQLPVALASEMLRMLCTTFACMVVATPTVAFLPGLEPDTLCRHFSVCCEHCYCVGVDI